MKKIAFMACIVSFLFCSCNNGLTINKNDFRDVPDYTVPELDEATGTNVYTASFSILDCTATTDFSEYGDTAFLKINDITEDKNELRLKLSLAGLITGDYSNVSVTANYTSLTEDSEDLVSRLQFDRYAQMVFEANTGTTSFDPSSATIVIDLNTVKRSQLGYITFSFKSAKSVYNQEASTASYTLYLNIEDTLDTAPVAVFFEANKTATDAKVNLTDYDNTGYTATFVNDLSVDASAVSQDFSIRFLNTVPEYPLDIAIHSASAEDGLTLSQTSSTDGIFSFTLNFAEETNKIKTTKNSYILEISDPNNYYQGLEEPFRYEVKSIRTYPAIVDPLKDSFANAGSASPWAWRIHYKQKEDGSVKKKSIDAKSTDVSSTKYEW